MDFVTLIGAEAVENAGHCIASSAETMRQAAASLESTVHFGLRRLEELVARLERLKGEE